MPLPSPLRAAALLSCLISFALPRAALAATAYVTNEKGDSVSVVNTDKLDVVKTIPVGQRPRGIALSTDGKQLYLCASDDDTIQIIDTKTLELSGNLDSGLDPELLIVSRDGKYVFTSNENNNLVTVIDTKTHRQLFS